MLSLLIAAILVCTPPVAPISAPSPASDFTSDVANLDEIVKPVLERSALPGMAVAVLTQDRLVALGVAGMRERGGNASIERGDRFHLGSCTKAVTATLAGLLVAEGKLRWESTIGEVLGPSVRVIHDSWKSITLDELLHHRGGAPTAADPADWSAAWACSGAPPECRAAFVTSMLARPIAQARGTFAYSNQGYSVVGRMCEIAGGKDWETLVVERVLKPIGITSAGFGPPTKATGGKAPRGHESTGVVRDIDNPAVIGPGGTLHLTMEDWARFVALHLRGETASELGMAPEYFAHLHAPPSSDKDQYACGWNVAERPWGGRVLTHSGSNTVWYCVAWLAPKPSDGPPFAILVACNEGGDEAAKSCDALAGAAIQWWSQRRKPAGKSDDAIRHRDPVH